jgi:hypothetical protein
MVYLTVVQRATSLTKLHGFDVPASLWTGVMQIRRRWRQSETCSGEEVDEIRREEEHGGSRQDAVARGIDA